MTLFTEKAPRLMRLLMDDFGLTDLDAAAVWGNAGHESLGFTKLQEMAPTVKGSRGGFGYFQWTGPRRRAYEAYCARNGYDPASEEANYKFLYVELVTTEGKAIPALKAAKTLEDKVKAFEKAYERAEVKHYPSRIKYAEQALAAFKAQGSVGLGPPVVVPPLPIPDKHTEPPEKVVKPDYPEAAPQRPFSLVAGIIVTLAAGSLIAGKWLGFF